MKKGAVGSRKNEAAIKSLAIRIKTLRLEFELDGLIPIGRSARRSYPIS